MANETRICFYVPDFLALRPVLDGVYLSFGVFEHSAEPAFVLDGDADVQVRGTAGRVAQFRTWLVANVANVVVK